MTDRVKEKLVELLFASLCRHIHKSCKLAENIADDLIANGVTIQKWIPVTERLPEPFVSVLVQMPVEHPFPTVREGFISKDGIWHSALYDREPGEVTHWQPMPQPPVDLTRMFENVSIDDLRAYREKTQPPKGE